MTLELVKPEPGPGKEPDRPAEISAQPRDREELEVAQTRCLRCGDGLNYSPILELAVCERCFGRHS